MTIGCRGWRGPGGPLGDQSGDAIGVRSEARTAAGSYPRRVPRSVVWTLYALLVLIWSSTWVAIKIGLGDLPALFGAGIRFALAGALLLAGAAIARRSLRTDPKLAAILAVLPFALTYGLVYWAEQHIPSGPDRGAVRRPPPLHRAAGRRAAPRRASAQTAPRRDRDRHLRAGARVQRVARARRRRPRRASPRSPPRSRPSPARSGRSRSSCAAGCSTSSSSTAGRCSAPACSCSS